MRPAIFVGLSALLAVSIPYPSSSYAEARNVDLTKTSALFALLATKAQLLSIMRTRHDGMEAIGKAARTTTRALTSDSPDLTAVRQSAGQIETLSRQASGWFPAGTGPELTKTRAKPEIWKNLRDFNGKMMLFQRSAAVFNRTAAGSNVDTIKAQYGQLARTCKACHDTYRSD